MPYGCVRLRCEEACARLGEVACACVKNEGSNCATHLWPHRASDARPSSRWRGELHVNGSGGAHSYTIGGHQRSLTGGRDGGTEVVGAAAQRLPRLLLRNSAAQPPLRPASTRSVVSKCWAGMGRLVRSMQGRAGSEAHLRCRSRQDVANATVDIEKWQVVAEDCAPEAESSSGICKHANSI